MSTNQSVDSERETGAAATPTADPGAHATDTNFDPETTVSETPHSKRSLRTDTRGAVMAEFAIALMPMLMAFFGFVQVSRAFQANLVLRHSAIVAARAAAVISNKNDNLPKEKDSDGNDNGNKDDGQEEIELAAALALRPFLDDGAFDDVTVEVDDKSTRDDPYGMVNVTVTATYNCGVPLGKLLVCGTSATLKKSITAGFPHQGAKYRTEE